MTLSLEERVAALEERLAYPLMAVDAGTPEFSDKQVAELREALEATGADGSAFRILPPRPLLTPELARELLRECVTVVKPGEVLVMRMPEGMPPNHIREMHDAVRYWRDCEAPGLKVLVVPACEFAVKEAEA